MAVTVETGAIVSGADSWVSRADYIAYALTLGVVIPDTSVADVELVKAGEFINHHEDNLKGILVTRDQEMSFPRYDLFLDGWSWSGTEIPRQVISCQMAFALDVHDGIDLYNRPQNPNLIKKSTKIDVIAVEYAVSENAPQKVGRTSTGDALLATLLNNSGLFSIELTRK